MDKVPENIVRSIENGVKSRHRTMFYIIGERSREQVPLLYNALVSCTDQSQPTILWGYKKKDDLISKFRSQGKKCNKEKDESCSGNETLDLKSFSRTYPIRGYQYSQSQDVLGKTYGVCVLQDFEALTPNILARTIETVEGGGLIIVLLNSVSSLKDLYTLKMDVHKHFCTEMHSSIDAHFNERFILSLAQCKRCLLMTDKFEVLPISAKALKLTTLNPAETLKNAEELADLRASLQETPIPGPLVNLCKTYDQANVIANLIQTLADKQVKAPVSVLAARGRGKSAALGLAIAAAIELRYVKIYVSSPHPENLLTLFQFVLNGFDALGYKEDKEYTIIRSTNPNYNNSIIRINVTRYIRQTIEYIAPTDTHLLNAADLLLIDEAAAIPLPLVKKMLGQYLVFLSSTINGYEGTGRSLSLKLMSQIQKDKNSTQSLKMQEPIRYGDGDVVEKWLMDVLCLEIDEVPQVSAGCPAPDACELYQINRHALFSYHKSAELFLHRLVAIYVSSHYKNSPNDLQMLCDAPAHDLYCLVAPIKSGEQVPEILVVIQVALEGQICEEKANSSAGWNRKASGDLIPWKIADQFGEREFLNLIGVRIVRIATHPNYQRMGYGKYAIKLLKDYYSGKFADLNEEGTAKCNQLSEPDEMEASTGLLNEIIRPKRKVPTLLKRLSECPPPHVDYIGTSYGLTEELLKFWKHARFIPLYISQKANDLTGEHSCIMLHSLVDEGDCAERLQKYFTEFRRVLMRLLGRSFRGFSTALAIGLLKNEAVQGTSNPLDKKTLDAYFSPYAMKRVESYARNMVDFRQILHLVRYIAVLYFEGRTENIQIDRIQESALLAIGLQDKSAESIATELKMPTSQVLAKFSNMWSKFSKYFQEIIESHVESVILKAAPVAERTALIQPKMLSLEDELNEGERELSEKQRKEWRTLKKEGLQEFTVKGSDADWSKALTGVAPSDGGKIISVKTGVKRLNDSIEDRDESIDIYSAAKENAKKKLKALKKKKTRK